MGYNVDTARLMERMGQKKKTLSDLAEATGVSISTLSNVLSGKKPNYGTMTAIARALELTGREAADIFFAADLPNS